MDVSLLRCLLCLSLRGVLSFAHKAMYPWIEITAILRKKDIVVMATVKLAKFLPEGNLFCPVFTV